MAAYRELRVHGVSGTPPEDMLYLGPVTYDQSTARARVYERHNDPFDVKAFHWGSLTAGSSVTALWILLAPFALANASGWMTDRSNSWSRAFGRLAGLSITALFFVQMSHIGLDIPYNALVSDTKGANNGLVVVIFLALVVLLTVGLLLLSTQSHFRRYTFVEKLKLGFWPIPKNMLPPEYWETMPPETQWDDPARGASLRQLAMWGTHAILHRLSRLHLGVGMVVLALVVGYGLDTPGLRLWSQVGVGVVSLLLLLTTWAPSSTLTRWGTAFTPVAGLTLAGWAAIEIAGADLTTASLSASGEMTFLVAVVLAASAALALVGEWVAGFKTLRWRCLLKGWVALGILAIAALLGASLGLTGALLAEDWTTSATNQATDSKILRQGGGWTAVAMLGLGILLGIVWIVLLFRRLQGEQTVPDLDDVAAESRIRRVLLRARTLLGFAGVYGLAVGVTAWVMACRFPAACDATRLGQASLRWAEGWEVELFGLSFDLGTLTGWAKLLMVVAPAFFIFRSIAGGLLRGQNSRRQVSILWDLGSFWPRWHHPLGPPAYSPNAVQRLKDELRTRRPTVLGAHSQGSLIGVVALDQLADGEVPQTFLTYGSQLGILYPLLFPTVEIDDIVAQVSDKLHGRWVNLWRRSDPIGGQYVTGLGPANWHVSTGSGHSRYELTPEYCQARLSLVAGDLDRPDDQAIAGCWQRPATAPSASEWS